jgi:mRNA-degrading endonuclease RelE of RelBE toxin-antitoxin system
VVAYQVELTARARNQYTALDPVIRDRIRRTLLDLADDPTPAQVKALAGGGGLLRSESAHGGSFTAWSMTRPAS